MQYRIKYYSTISGNDHSDCLYLASCSNISTSLTSVATYHILVYTHAKAAQFAMRLASLEPASQNVEAHQSSPLVQFTSPVK